MRPLEAGWKSWPASERGPVEPYKSVITPFEDFETQRGFLASSASELNFRLGSNCEELTQGTHVRVAPNNRHGAAEKKQPFVFLVARFNQIDGYRCLSLMRALAVVKCQSALA